MCACPRPASFVCHLFTSLDDNEYVAQIRDRYDSHHMVTLHRLIYTNYGLRYVLYRELHIRENGTVHAGSRITAYLNICKSSTCIHNLPTKRSNAIGDTQEGGLVWQFLNVHPPPHHAHPRLSKPCTASGCVVLWPQGWCCSPLDRQHPLASTARHLPPYTYRSSIPKSRSFPI